MFAPVKILSALGAVALFAGAAAASTSAATPQVRSAEVRYGDLNLADKAGQAQLRSRITRAAMKVCTDPSNRLLDAKCRWEAVNRAKAPVASAIAKAESGERYADAGNVVVAAGN